MSGQFEWFDEPLNTQRRYEYRICAAYGTGVAQYESGCKEDDDLELLTWWRRLRGEEDVAIASLRRPANAEDRAPVGAMPAREGEKAEFAAYLGGIACGQCTDAATSMSLASTEAEPPACWQEPFGTDESLADSPGSTEYVYMQEAIEGISDKQELAGPAHIGETADPPWEISLLWADHLGSTRAVSSLTGDRVTRHGYYPFGERALGEPDFATKEFTGHERDRETGLDYMFARYYGSATGRFCSADPIQGNTQDPTSFNKFAYVRNNPPNLIDPYGLYWAQGTPMPIIPGDPNGCTMCNEGSDPNAEPEVRPPPGTGYTPEEYTWIPPREAGRRGKWVPKIMKDAKAKGKPVEISFHPDPTQPHFDVERGKGPREHWAPDGRRLDPDVSKQIITTVLIGAGVIAWEVGKWAVAAWTAPPTGGLSLAGAAATP